jgi:hypothetical protein
MRTLLWAFLLVVLKASASPFNGGKLHDVIKEARNMNDLIAQQLNDLDMDGTDMTTTATDSPIVTDSLQTTNTNTDSQTIMTNTNAQTTMTNTNAQTTMTNTNAQTIMTNTDSQTTMAKTDSPTTMTKTDSQTTDSYEPTTGEPPVRGTTHRPIDKSIILKEFPFMKQSYKDLVKFYWSLHMIRKMIEKHTMMLMGKETPKSRPFFLPLSSLIKTAMEQIKDVSECMSIMAEIAKKLGFKPKENHCNDDDEWDLGETELQFYLKAEMKTAKVYWMTNILMHFIKKMNETKEPGANTAPHDQGYGTTSTPKTPMMSTEDFLKKFAQMLHHALRELPSLYKKLEQLKQHIEEKEKEVFGKLGLKHPNF